MKRIIILSGLGMLFALTSFVFAAVPPLINFQGILRDGSGNPVPNSTYSVTFRIYDAPTGGNVFWTETQSVTTTNGLFTVSLGAITSVPDTVFDGSSAYLGIKVSNDAEMTPRQRLGSVGYSFASGPWSSLGSNVFKLTGNLGIGTSSPGAKLEVAKDNTTPALLLTHPDATDA
ncbi:MAG: hypothetical protein ACRECJ_08610, partial [Limisphaerales bacterium]